MFTLQGQHLNRRGKQRLSRRVADYVLNLRHGEKRPVLEAQSTGTIKVIDAYMN